MSHQNMSRQQSYEVRSKRAKAYVARELAKAQASYAAQHATEAGERSTAFELGWLTSAFEIMLTNSPHLVDDED